MLNVALRRFRIESFTIAAGLLALSLLAITTGHTMSDQYNSSGLADCLASETPSICNNLRDAFGERFASLQLLIVPLILLPALLGAFIGAPLVARELEHGTHRFLWTQGVTRRRWFASMTGAALLLALLAGTVYATIVGLWLDITNEVSDERFSRLYEFQGVMPIAAGVFAVAVGIAAGLILRRTLPAMVATIAVFIIVRFTTATALRPNFAAPETLATTHQPDNPLQGTGAWVLSQQTVSSDGVVLGTNGSIKLTGLERSCPGIRSASPLTPTGDDLVQQCLEQLGVRSHIRYHPGNRFWTFQLIESGILLALAGAAMLIALRALDHRPT
jgi:hypothetical protein